MRQLGLEVSLRKSIAPLCPAQDLHAGDADRGQRPLKPTSQRLAVESLAVPNDGTVQVPVAVTMPFHVKRKRLAESRRVVPFSGFRLRELIDLSRPRAPLRSIAGEGGRRGESGSRLRTMDRRGRSGFRSPRSRGNDPVRRFRTCVRAPRWDELFAELGILGTNDGVERWPDLLLGCDQVWISYPGVRSDLPPRVAGGTQGRAFVTDDQIEEVGFETVGIRPQQG